MAWFALFVSAVFEAVWATALGQSEGLTRPLPTFVFLTALLGSIIGLVYAAKKIPMGTGYAVWTGTGAALTVAYAIFTGAEESSPLKILFLAGIIGSVVGLKLIGTKAPPLGDAATAEGTYRAASAVVARNESVVPSPSVEKTIAKALHLPTKVNQQPRRPRRTHD